MPEKNVELYQTVNTNSLKNYIASTNLKTKGMQKEWVQLWEQIELWYGDIDKKETCEEFLIRQQNSFTIEAKK